MQDRMNERQRFKAAKRKAQKWLRRATVQEVCPFCGADVRDPCGCAALVPVPDPARETC